MPKRVLQLWVDTNLVEIAKSKGINMSQLFNQVLQNVVESPERLEVMQEEVLKEKIVKLSEELNTTKALLIQIDKEKHGEILTEEVIDINENTEKKRDIDTT